MVERQEKMITASVGQTVALCCPSGQKGKAVYGRRQPNCRVHRTTKTAAFLFLVEANLFNEASVKLLPHCKRIAAHQKQRAITSRRCHLVLLSKTSVHWSVSQTIAALAQKQNVAEGAATTGSVGQTIAPMSLAWFKQHS